MTDLVLALPSKGRPDSVGRTRQALDDTGAWADGVRVFYALDPGDRELKAYRHAIERCYPEGDQLVRVIESQNDGMAGPTNLIARTLIGEGDEGEWRPLALMSLGDDHVPRTHGWASRLLDELIAMPAATGTVYPNDGHRGENLATCWATSFNVVQAINRLVPALVTHLFSDNAAMTLAASAGCLTYVPDVLVEHMHYLAGKSERDAGYVRINSRHRFAADKAIFDRWRLGSKMARQVEAIRELIAARLADDAWRQPDPEPATFGDPVENPTYVPDVFADPAAVEEPETVESIAPGLTTTGAGSGVSGPRSGRKAAPRKAAK